MIEWIIVSIFTFACGFVTGGLWVNGKYGKLLVNERDNKK